MTYPVFSLSLFVVVFFSSPRRTSWSAYLGEAKSNEVYERVENRSKAFARVDYVERLQIVRYQVWALAMWGPDSRRVFSVT